MVKDVEAKTIFEQHDNEKIRQMYAKVVGLNHIYVKKGFIKCPECDEEILITPTLRKMNVAIESHVQLHKETIDSNPLKYTSSIRIRLALTHQILYNP